MKRIFLPFLILTFSITSCTSVGVFNTPNDLRNIYGELYLANGDTLQGLLYVNNRSFMDKDVKIYVDGEKKPMQFNRMDVKGYSIRNDFYDLKELKKGGLNVGKEHAFIKRLTPPGSKIHLYEHIDKITTSDSKGSATRYETEYYMQIPKEAGNVVWPLSGSRFVPGFDEKMSRLVSDCSALAQKIVRKEQGYFVAQVSLFREKRADVMLRIIKEYNECR